MRKKCLGIFLVSLAIGLTTSDAHAEISEAQATAFAEQIEASIAKGDGSVLDNAIDAHAVAQTAMAGLGSPPAIANGLETGIRQAALGRQIVSQLGDDGSYQFLRVRGAAGQRRVLFRLLCITGLNYQDLYLSDATGKIRISDIYIFAIGEPLTQTYHRLMLPVIAQANRGAVARLFGSDADLVAHVAEVQQFTKLSQAKKPADALKVYDALPDSLKHEKALMGQAMADLQLTDHAKYLAAMDDYAKLFPNDPSVLLVSIDQLYLRKQFAEMRAKVDQIDKLVGGDPYLDLYRGNSYLADNNFAAARPMYLRLQKAEPAMKASYFQLLTIALHDKQWDETVRLLNLTEANTKIHFDDNFNNGKLYAEFMKSPQYKKWASGRSAAATEPPAAAEQ